MIYYLNGRYVPAEQATLPLGDLAIVRGFGIFDYLRTYGHEPFMLHEHVLRLQRSAEQIGLELPLGVSEIESVVRECNDRNECADVGIRIVVTGGESSNYLLPQNKATIAVMPHKLKPYPAAYYRDGASVTTTQIPRLMPTVKSLNYLGAIIAVREAEQSGAMEALYRTADGRITEGTRSNVFLVREGRVQTPVREVLPGITRQAVLEAIEGVYEVIESDILYDDVLSADEVFLTSTTKEVMPISRVDGSTIGNGRPGEHSLDIADRFRAFVQERTPAIPR
jgi:branched-chain amino acid aminotransferase